MVRLLTSLPALLAPSPSSSTQTHGAHVPLTHWTSFPILSASKWQSPAPQSCISLAGWDPGWVAQAWSMGEEAGQGMVRDVEEKGDHRQTMGKGNGTLEVGAGRFFPTAVHLPLPAEQPSRALRVLHPWLSQESQDQGV